MGVDEEFEEFEEFEGFEEFPPVVLDARRGSANVAPQAHPPQSHPNSSCALSQDIPHSLTLRGSNMSERTKQLRFPSASSPRNRMFVRSRFWHTGAFNVVDSVFWIHGWHDRSQIHGEVYDMLRTLEKQRLGRRARDRRRIPGNANRGHQTIDRPQAKSTTAREKFR